MAGSKRNRSVSTTVMADLVKKFIEQTKHTDSKPVLVDPDKFATEFNVTTSVSDKVYIAALRQGLTNVYLEDQTKPTVKHKAAYVTPKGGILLSTGTVKDLNKNLGDKDKFQQGDEFDVTQEGDKIVLTRVAREAHQEMASLEEASTSEVSSGEDS